MDRATLCINLSYLIAIGERAEKDLDKEAFAMYWLLRGEGVKEPEDTAKQMEKVFTDYPHWKNSEAQAREVRKELYKILISKGVKDKTPFAKRIMQYMGREVS